MEMLVWKSVCLHCFSKFFELEGEWRIVCPSCRKRMGEQDVVRCHEANRIDIDVLWDSGFVVELRNEIVQKRVKDRTSADVSGTDYGDPWDVRPEEGRELH